MRAPIIAICLAANTATAQTVTVQFRDGAPKDSITLTNTGCPITDAAFTLDLSGSRGALIFDTSASGAGVEVFQPVEIVSGNVTLGPVGDGDTTLNIDLAMFPTDAIIRLTADLDDTLAGGRQITVSGSEIAGTTVVATVNGAKTQGVFDDSGTVEMTIASACWPT